MTVDASVSAPAPDRVASPEIVVNANVVAAVASSTCPAVLPEIVCSAPSRACAVGVRGSASRESLPWQTVPAAVP